ncbi:zinc ribbon domain-containing protein [Mitsuokella sp.]|uniref:zinc ribbon domain-containing protein n=1 Tax=Mitsuokella sp. TaxID=2049034 RepID=UPI003D7E23DB
MKKCIHCQAVIPDEAEFCPECGTKQPVMQNPAQPAAPMTNQGANMTMPQGQPNAGQNNAYAQAAQSFVQSGADTAQQMSQKFFARVGNMMRWEKIAYIGLGMIAISVLLPLISISIISCLTSMVNISQLMTFAVLAFCCLAGYYVSEEKYNIPLSINIGLLVTFAVIYCKLHFAIVDFFDKTKKGAQAASQMTGGLDFGLGANFVQEFADKIVGLGIGVYFLLAGAFIVIIACAACRLSRKNLPVNIGSICTEAKDAMLEPAVMGNQRIPAFILTILVVGVLLFIAMNIEVFGFRISSLL